LFQFCFPDRFFSLPTYLEYQVGSLTMENVEPVFQQIDKDGSGEIDEAEIVQFFKTCNAPVEPAIAAALLKEADHDGTGKMDKYGKNPHVFSCGHTQHTTGTHMYITCSQVHPRLRAQVQ
jgi:hypothetical protein